MAVATIKGRKLRIDWSEELGFGVPEGRYLFKVTDADTGESQKGDPQVILDLIVVAPKKHKGKKQKVWFTLTPGALRFFREACEALLGKDMPRKASAVDLDSFIGKTAYAEAQKTGDFVNIVNWESASPVDDDEDVDDADLDLDEYVMDEEDEDDEDDEDDWDDDDVPFDTDDDEEEPKPRSRRGRK